MHAFLVAHYHLKRYAPKRLAMNKVFDKVKRKLFCTEIFNQVCYRHFMETLNNHTNLWEMGI